MIVVSHEWQMLGVLLQPMCMASCRFGPGASKAYSKGIGPDDQLWKACSKHTERIVRTC